MSAQILQPAGWTRPRGYVNGIAASGRMIFVAGQVGWNGAGVFESDDLVLQSAQALRNIVAVLAEGGARPEHIVRMTWYLLDKREYVNRVHELGAVYRKVIGGTFAAMSAIQVGALIEDRAQVEIEVTAVIP